MLPMLVELSEEELQFIVDEFEKEKSDVEENEAMKRKIIDKLEKTSIDWANSPMNRPK